MLPPPPKPTLFPSRRSSDLLLRRMAQGERVRCAEHLCRDSAHRHVGISAAQPVRAGPGRSEEHTSELQSHVNLVCRLLLEKKKRRLEDVAALAVTYYWSASF